MIYNLFPTPVARYKLKRKLTNKELKFINSQDLYASTGNSISANNKILECSELCLIQDFVNDCIKQYFNEVYSPKNKVELKITQSWANYTKPKEFHHKHSHSNSFVSGVFYVQVDSEKDKIHFFKERYQQLRLTPKEFNSWNSQSWWLPVETCDLLLFPSSLVHMVETVESENTRISLAFNTFPFGTIGDDYDLTGLTIASHQIL